MHQSFTGNSRRPRQVNLSGRNNPNPFANTSGASWSSGAGNSRSAATPSRTNALASAQQDRLARQQERERTLAATLVQKRWRGNIARRDVRTLQRASWDEVEARNRSKDTQMRGASPLDADFESSNYVESTIPYPSDADALSQLWMLLRFVDPQREDDFLRLRHLFARLKATKGSETVATRPWPPAYLSLEQMCLSALERLSPPTGDSYLKIDFLSDVVRFAVQRIPPEVAEYHVYYEGLGHLIQTQPIDMDLATIPLQQISAATPKAYEQFSIHILTQQSLYKMVGGLKGLSNLASQINCKILGNSLAEWLRNASPNDFRILANLNATQRSSLLGYFIYFYRQTYNFTEEERYSSDKDFVLVVGTLLSSLADEVEIEANDSDLDNEPDSSPGSNKADVLDSFVRDQIVSLVTQKSIGSFLGLVDNAASEEQLDAQNSNSHSRVLAAYILTLLRLFPKRRIEIRLWLYMGMSSRRNSSGEVLPVIRYFWQASANTHVFDTIIAEPREAIKLLKPRLISSRDASNRAAPILHSDTDDQWRVILIFVELYMFVLKFMDDDEFFGHSKSTSGSQLGHSSNTLTLDEVQRLTTFLKHLGFTMYYNAADILRGPLDETKPTKNGELFRPRQLAEEKTTADSRQPERTGSTHIAGVQGMSLDYVKGLVTGLLRALYERDSRRPFLPQGHWLMTSRFDMNNFIDAVVEEEERRHQVQEADEEDADDHDDDADLAEPSYRLVGTQHTQRLRATERMRREQRRASRKGYLQAVAPRLEILQNMPFLIPFTTRVKVFRRFVYMDQRKRRLGIIDGEMWRLQQMHDPSGEGHNRLARHHAKIRREHEFEDAYEQFNDLGVALKEPIHITFVDQWDTPEAGIDGGGVTKEFLTSVTNQAFAPSEGIQMFAENDQHLLYPNPSAVEEQKELLREVGFEENSSTFQAQVSDILQRYEFLGRIIGKCLYEGILVDIGFAPFFLLKWALTGGTGSAPLESGYRANINDLRDLDEGLYQGLLQLKNYPGDVEDFSLNFTVTDTLNIPGPQGTTRTKTMTHDLDKNGSDMAVTNANRPMYMFYMARHRLSWQPWKQTNAFLRGLAAIIQPSWLSMFNQNELQTLVGGAAAQISVPDLRANTIYGGVYTIGDDGLEHESVRIFWDVMEALSDEDRRKVLKFVTSTPRAPLLGFGSLNPRFSIRDAGGDQSRLPSTSTCVNLLKLPRYSDAAMCRAKLLQAVNAGAGFDLS